MNAVELVQPSFDLSGRRVLFVANRTDNELEARLRTALHEPELEWLVIAPRQTQAAAERVEAGRYDLVMASTRFIGHSVDGALSGACKAVGIPYLRVDKGRPTTVVEKLKSHFRDGTVPEKKKRGAAAGVPLVRWSSPEFWWLQHLRAKGLEYADIAAYFKEQGWPERTPGTVSQTWRSYFGRGANRKLPDDYSAVKAAMEHKLKQTLLPPPPATVGDAEARAMIEQTAIEPAQRTQLALAGTTAISITSSKDGQITVEIRGTKGNALVETTRSLAEVMAFLVV
jgi:hypothetical protein